MLTRDRLLEILQTGNQYCPHDLFTDESGLAYFLEISSRTVRAWREVGKGPPARYTTRTIYDIDSILDWYNFDLVKDSEKIT